MTLESDNADNERLCKELLGWSRVGQGWWKIHNEKGALVNVVMTPAFLDGAGMLVLLDALERHGQWPIVQCMDNDPREWWCAGGTRDQPVYDFEARAPTAPAAVRAAAIAFVSEHL